jgi:hypothetical protein
MRVFILGATFGIVCLYLGARTFFHGSLHLRKPIIIFILILTIGYAIAVQLTPNLIIIISLDPVNSQLNLFIGILMFLWHMTFCLLCIRYLMQVRNSAKESKEYVLAKNIQYIIIGFYLSICAVITYGVGYFGEAGVTDYIFVSFELIDLLFIWRGLVLPRFEH